MLDIRRTSRPAGGTCSAQQALADRFAQPDGAVGESRIRSAGACAPVFWLADLAESA